LVVNNLLNFFGHQTEIRTARCTYVVGIKTNCLYATSTNILALIVQTAQEIFQDVTLTFPGKSRNIHWCQKIVLEIRPYHEAVQEYCQAHAVVGIFDTATI
jgi:hypothetical protein